VTDLDTHGHTVEKAQAQEPLLDVDADPATSGTHIEGAFVLPAGHSDGWYDYTRHVQTPTS
jgi:hypothetical protein